MIHNKQNDVPTTCARTNYSIFVLGFLADVGIADSEGRISGRSSASEKSFTRRQKSQLLTRRSLRVFSSFQAALSSPVQSPGSLSQRVTTTLAATAAGLSTSVQSGPSSGKQGRQQVASLSCSETLLANQTGLVLPSTHLPRTKLRD